MPDQTPDPIRQLERFTTDDLVSAPLDPAQVRRLGDRRRTRRHVGLVAASVLAVLVAATPVAFLAHRDGGDDAPAPAVTTSASPSPAPTTPTVITYPGIGLRVTNAADAHKLTDTTAAFRAFIAGQAVRAATEGESCPDAAHGVAVQKYSSAGYAIGSVNSCGGYVALWVDHDGHWQEGYGTQDTWDCATLRYFGVPRSFATGCADEASDDFGPKTVAGLRLGMTVDQLNATDAWVDPAPASGCAGLLLPHQQEVADQTDGYVSPTDGLVAIFARPGMKTPQGIGLGSTLAELRAAYSDATRANGYWVVPVDGQTEYEFGIEQSGIVGELLLTRTTQDCFG
jgi:hypothetical protein